MMAGSAASASMAQRLGIINQQFHVVAPVTSTALSRYSSAAPSTPSATSSPIKVTANAVLGSSGFSSLRLHEPGPLLPATCYVLRCAQPSTTAFSIITLSSRLFKHLSAQLCSSNISSLPPRALSPSRPRALLGALLQAVHPDVAANVHCSIVVRPPPPRLQHARPRRLGGRR